MDKETKMVIFSLLLAVICRPVVSGEWKVYVVNNLDALVTSCVVVPCSFTHPGGNLPSSRLRGIWHYPNSPDQVIFHEDKTRILDNFKDRTQLLGHLGENNCTLEIMDLKNHDNGPFCFRIELVRTEDNEPTIEKYSYVERCVQLKMLPEPPNPTLITPKAAIQGQPYTVICSVIHSCPSHQPKLTWNWENAKVSEHYKGTHFGDWEAVSILTIIPEEKDDHSEITCTAEFNGQRTSSKTLTLYVKRTVNYNHIIIPAVVGIGTTVIFGLLCLFMMKKYKSRIAELQSQDGSIWNRLSRMSRRSRPDGAGPPRSNQRQSIWRTFSRRPKGDTLDSGHIPNNVYPKSCAALQVSKPPFPSPKSQPKSCNYKEDFDDGDDYINTADLNIYGNL